jgi:hypothetical protein
MRDEEFCLKGRGALIIMGISLLVIVVAAVYLLFGLGDSPLACLAVPFGFLVFILSLRVATSDDLGAFKAIRAFWSIRKIVVSGSGIALHRMDNSIASEAAWHEVVDVQYLIMRRKVWGTEVSREPDSLSFKLTGGRTFEIPLRIILRKEDSARMVRAVVTHIAAAGFQPREVRPL